MSGGKYEATLIPAHTFHDGLNIVLSPSEINDILLQICIEDEAEDLPGDDDGDDINANVIEITLPKLMPMMDAARMIGTQLDENPDTERILVRGEGCKNHHYSVVAACMAWYAICRRCPRVNIRDSFNEDDDGPRRIGHSKGYALRKYALTSRPSGFSALMLMGIARNQMECAHTSPKHK